MSRPARDNRIELCDLLDRILDVGVVLRGNVTIKIADIDMIYIELAVLIAAADRVLDMKRPEKCPTK